jgi:hypothetical protein
MNETTGNKSSQTGDWYLQRLQHGGLRQGGETGTGVAHQGIAYLGIYLLFFFSIGLTTRFRELAAAGSKPFWAFTSGVAVNVVIGFILSVIVFGDYWARLGQ